MKRQLSSAMALPAMDCAIVVAYVLMSVSRRRRISSVAVLASLHLGDVFTACEAALLSIERWSKNCWWFVDELIGLRTKRSGQQYQNGSINDGIPCCVAASISPITSISVMAEYPGGHERGGMNLELARSASRRGTNRSKPKAFISTM